MSHRPATDDALQAEIFDLRARNASLSDRIADLCGGTSGAALQEELLQVRQQLANKDSDLSDLNDLFCKVESETAQIRAERDAIQQRVAIAEAAAEKTAALEAAAEDAARKHVVTVNALARESFGVRLLASSLSEAEERAERAVREKAELLASTLVSRDATEQALARSARGKDELEEALRTAQAEAARHHGALGALETRVADLSSQLSSARAQADSAGERAIASEATVGSLQVELAAAHEAVRRAQGDAQRANTHADEARAELSARSADVADRNCVIANLRSELQEVREAAAAAEAESEARVAALEAAAQMTAATMEEQRLAADAVGGDLKSALAEANLATAAARQEAERARHESEMMRQALTHAQTQASLEQSREAQRASAELIALRAERDEMVASLQRQVDEHSSARYASEAKLKAAQEETRRLGRLERSELKLKAEVQALQAEVQKKTEMLDRFFKRKGASVAGASSVGAPTAQAIAAMSAAEALPAPAPAMPPLPTALPPDALALAPATATTTATAMVATPAVAPAATADAEAIDDVPPPLPPLDVSDDSKQQQQQGPLRAFALQASSAQAGVKPAGESGEEIAMRRICQPPPQAAAAAASKSGGGLSKLTSHSKGGHGGSGGIVCYSDPESALAAPASSSRTVGAGEIGGLRGGVASSCKENVTASNIYSGGMAGGIGSKVGGLAGGLGSRGNARQPSPRPGDCGGGMARDRLSTGSNASSVSSSGRSRSVHVQSRYLSPSVRKM